MRMKKISVRCCVDLGFNDLFGFNYERSDPISVLSVIFVCLHSSFFTLHSSLFTSQISFVSLINASCFLCGFLRFHELTVSMILAISSWSSVSFAR